MTVICGRDISRNLKNFVLVELIWKDKQYEEIEQDAHDGRGLASEHEPEHASIEKVKKAKDPNNKMNAFEAKRY